MTGDAKHGALVLRRATLADAPAIQALTRQAYAKWVALIGREPAPMRADYVERVQQHRIDLLYLGDELAALIEMSPETAHLLIDNVAVSPALQKRGYGRKMIQHAEDVAASLGYDEVRLYTNKRFVENVRLYRKLGYRIDAEEVTAAGVRVHMSKRFANRDAATCSTSP